MSARAAKHEDEDPSVVVVLCSVLAPGATRSFKSSVDCRCLYLVQVQPPCCIMSMCRLPTVTARSHVSTVAGV